MALYKILAINPGSTSTKIAVYENEQLVFGKSIRHESADLSRYPQMSHQFEFRKELILRELSEKGILLSDLSAIVGRGGLLKPIPSGVYEVNQAMIDDLFRGVQGEHASNLGGLIAADMVKELSGCKAYIADPVVV
ncbi:MAG: butyrate kinase, partial [Bacteroidales bacterium]|nr:butyrate kinase [Bacteroidales bacterium]